MAGSFTANAPEAPFAGPQCRAWDADGGREPRIYHRSSPFRDFPFFVRIVLAANRTKLLDLEFFGHRPLVFRRRVICPRAVAAGHFDDVAHGSPCSGALLVVVVAVVKAVGTVVVFLDAVLSRTAASLER